MDSKTALDIHSYFVYWGQISKSRHGGFVYDGNQMTWSSVYGPNGCYPQNVESAEDDYGENYYGFDPNFNDGDL